MWPATSLAAEMEDHLGHQIQYLILIIVDQVQHCTAIESILLGLL